ncbi:MAG: hypothetical protein WCW31_02280, partial [Patescibacteria group bacterium]
MADYQPSLHLLYAGRASRSFSEGMINQKSAFAPIGLWPTTSLRFTIFTLAAPAEASAKAG